MKKIQIEETQVPQKLEYYNNERPLADYFKEIGKIRDIVGNDTTFAFIGDEKTLTVYLEGDCCSMTYFDEIYNKEALVGQEVIQVLDFDQKTNRQITLMIPEDKSEENIIYELVLVTKKGHCHIICHNASNGYYGGSIGGVKVSSNSKK